MEIFEDSTPKEKLLQILQVSGPSAVGLALDDLFLRLIACEELLLAKDIGDEEIEAKKSELIITSELDDIYIDLQAKIVSCE